MSKSDKVQVPPLKVLCLGLGRTGTTSLKFALQELGYKNVYDFADVIFKDQPGPWHEAVRAKFYRGEKVNFREGPLAELLAESEAGADLPFCLFYEDLIEQFPDAKVILTTRKLDAWMASMKQTIAHPQNSCLWFRIAGWFDWKWGRVFNLFDDYHYQVWGSDFDKNGPKAFTDHNDAVRRLVPPERLLEYVPGQGWEPLCKFLDKPVPTTEYPHAWTAAEYRSMSMRMVNGLYIKFFRRLALVAVPTLAATWYLWQR